MNDLRKVRRNRYRFYGLALFCTLLVIFTAGIEPKGETQPEPARSAYSFVDSIGVAVHLNYTDTVYGNYDNIIKPRLQELGIHHIRDGVSPGDTNTQQKFNELAKLGIKSTLVMDPRGVIPADAVTIANAVASSIEAVEGPNEWDIQSGLTYKNQPFPDGIRMFQNELYAAIKNDPITAHLDVLSPSMAYPENASRLGNIACDFATMHSYAGGGLPSDQLETRWIPNTQPMCGNKPIVATESGWHNAMDDGGAPQRAVSEAASGKYVPRLFLEYFNRGIKRAFVYELINLRQEVHQDSNFGLLRNNGSPKPSFTALKNLISLLKDSSANFPLGGLDYSLNGDTANVHHTLLQKSDGKFYLIFWQEISSFDTQQKTEIAVPARQMTLTFNTQIIAANGYEPVHSISPVWQAANPKTVELNIPDHPLVIELLPAMI